MFSSEILEAFSDPLILFSDPETKISLGVICPWDDKIEGELYVTNRAAQKWLKEDKFQRNLVGIDGSGKIAWLVGKARGVKSDSINLYFTRIGGIDCDWVQQHLIYEQARLRVIKDGFHNAFAETWDGHIFQVNMLTGDLWWITWYKN